MKKKPKLFMLVKHGSAGIAIRPMHEVAWVTKHKGLGWDMEILASGLTLAEAHERIAHIKSGEIAARIMQRDANHLSNSGLK